MHSTTGAFALPFFVTAMLLTGGCTETRFEQATGEGTIRGVNAVSGLADVDFRIEELSLGSIAFKTSTPASTYDNLNYTFNFDLPIPGQAADRLASVNLDVEDATDYTFVLAGDTATQEIFVWERAAREWSSDETVFEADFGHADPAFGTVDVYFAPEGTVPVPGNALGTLAFGERLEAVEFEGGIYQVILTAPGDASTILYRSIAISYPAAQSYTLALFEADPSITGPASLRRINEGGGTTGNLADERFAPTVQFVNTSLGTGNIDVAIDGDFANPAVADLAFGEVSADVEVPAGAATYQFAPTGNTMSLLDLDSTIAAGTRNMILLTGEPGNLSTLQAGSVRRGFSTVSRLRVTSAVTTIDTLDAYIRAPGTDIADVGPSILAATLGFSSIGTQIAGDYDFTVTVSGEKTVVGGPQAVALPVADFIEVILLDTPDPNVVDLLVFSNINP